MARKFIQNAIKHPGALRSALGAKSHKGPRGGTVKEPIPLTKIRNTISMLSNKAKGNKKLSPKDLTLLKRARLALTLKKFH